MKTALVIGATGVSGRALLSHLETLPDWSVIGVARHGPYFPTRVRFVSADLLDAQSCRESLAELKEVTHVFYTAYQDHADVSRTREPNTRMFANAMTGIASLKKLQNVCLLQGTKYYGQHLGPFKTPAKESDPRIPIPHFYYDQEDLLLQLSEENSWAWSCARPHVICGVSLGNPLNIIAILAVYTTLMRECGRPLTFPGKPGAFTSIYQATDAALLARAMVWMASTPACANQAFNVTNGDFFRYQNLWPVFAEFFGMEAGGVETVDLASVMSNKEPAWSAIIQRYGLEPHPLSTLVNWNFANFAFSNAWDVMSDTTKLRNFGFFDFVDSQQMFVKYFCALRDKKIIP